MSNSSIFLICLNIMIWLFFLIFLIKYYKKSGIIIQKKKIMTKLLGSSRQILLAITLVLFSLIIKIFGSNLSINDALEITSTLGFVCLLFLIIIENLLKNND